MRGLVAAPTRRDQAAPLEQVPDRADRRPVDPRVARAQVVEELLRAPGAAFPPGGDEELGDGVVDAVWAMVWRAAPVVEAGFPLGVVAREPLVADPPADPEPRAELGHKEGARGSPAPFV